jgi:hypothetical protein
MTRRREPLADGGHIPHLCLRPVRVLSRRVITGDSDPGGMEL